MGGPAAHLPVRPRCRPQLLSLRAQRRREDEGKPFSLFGNPFSHEQLSKEAREEVDKQRETLPSIALLPVRLAPSLTRLLITTSKLYLNNNLYTLHSPCTLPH